MSDGISTYEPPSFTALQIASDLPGSALTHMAEDIRA